MDEPTPASFETLQPTRSLSERVGERLRQELLDGRLKPGDRLPTEQSLVASFGVSRTVVREAIAGLRADGLVETRQGRGTIVSAEADRQAFRIATAEVSGLERAVQLMELRLAVEVEAAAGAARHRSAARLAGLAEALARIDRSVERGGNAIAADFDFHLQIAMASGNPYFSRFLRYLGRLIIPRQSVRVGIADRAARKAYLQRVQVEHRSILEAIAAGDEAGAREAMRRHLDNSRQRYRQIAAAAQG